MLLYYSFVEHYERVTKTKYSLVDFPTYFVMNQRKNVNGVYILIDACTSCDLNASTQATSLRLDTIILFSVTFDPPFVGAH